MSSLAVPVALAAAVSFGWSTALMHHGASSADERTGGFALLRHVVAQKRWLLGMAVSLFGLGLHAFALHVGSLTLVQPLVVSGLFFSLVFRDVLDRRWPGRTTVVWGLVTAAGLALFIGAAGAAGGTDVPDGAHTAVLLGCGAAVVVVAYWLAQLRRWRPGLLMGIAAGTVFGLDAGVIKAVTTAVAHHRLLTSWPLYALGVMGLTGFLLNQRAYQRTRLADFLPTLNMVNPVVALVFGVVVYDERPRSSSIAVLLEAVGLGVVLLGIFVLGREEAEEDAEDAEALTG